MKYFLAGLGIGALIGLVFAPMSGEGTRNMLSDQVNAVSEKASNTIQQASEKVSSVLRKGSQSTAGENRIISADDSGPTAATT